MAEYDNTNRGAIFVNSKKTDENHPDRTGSLNVGGVDYWISGWLKKDKNGKAYMSLQVKPIKPKDGPQKQQKHDPQDFSDIPNNLPF